MVKVFSGIRPSGKLHLGNYLGAIKNWIELQNSAQQSIFAVVDYHGITTPYDPKTYQQQIMDVVLDYLAAGIDPDPSADGPLLIRQSKVPQHTELAWLFNTITSIGWLDRLPTYKEQLEKTGVNNMALLDYPVLMAADILIYKSNLVPVGEDQLPHIDLTNEIAKRFNSLFGETLPVVKPHLAEGFRIMSLQDPTKKMSKTGDEGIALSDDPDTIRTKIKKAVTDSGKEVRYDEKEKPAISNLLTIYHLLSGKEIKTLEKKYDGQSYVEFKNDLAEVVVNFLKPFQEKRKKFEDNPDRVMEILTKSEEKARVLASSTLKEIKERMGLE
ncbi:MAG: tryptophan--tRNA ligase [Candidatus Yanofskybacteria bacterium RIFCSPHIGHO2_01_FULL_42_12]|uniref:Tryptophan--tRNA ligase n=1 Tax=Candidatus Yanofskybacteria bacterium RIFCSPLOWO2_01_FULL_42_49 TaxID=1802694 RepID=A0A1F8GCH8_9BACT|nr:MAG: tryptophan--tRNA ligase [Candidatus Yanofskybacteria bacterium RIFCSPHIGHO2_01_FULL_42_12]OGN23033.1 MAG: tryptophan--tRNA ligase [Candidatus Yanofskybacteria bacterium RIFCSPLOWO2_01_FULL_42_49]